MALCLCSEKIQMTWTCTGGGRKDIHINTFCFVDGINA